ncbi:DUF885 domain-containing protein [Lacimicrobium alkaliphilum]|uniref:DUF885 domain-containing protein n=1 Tax=Lacimicrobium alkaliphilum TaxID=1526571 RepID=A0A0U2ZC69_9ALTE|nr:DUF885 domain-containing protein [Lacimicrobium alkaliphilum]ALT00117.1 hypothetical protein AT746_18805 [Lacimicrobium alkaliphilum]
MLKALLAGLFLILTASVSANQKLDSLLDEIWQFELRINPTMATSRGVHQYDHLLSDVSAEGLKAQYQQAKAYLQQLDKLAGQDLNKQDQISLQMQRRRLQEMVDSYDYNAHYMPITSEYGFHSGLAFLTRTSKFNTVQDYENYLTRLTAFEDYFNHQISWMRKGLETGLTQPKVVLKDFEKTALAFVHDDATQSQFYSPFSTMPAAINSNKQAALQEQAKKVISNTVMPAYQQFYDFLVEEYIPGAKEDIAAKSWPKGAEYYENRARYYTTLDMSSEEVHQLGLQEVKRIREDMQQVIDEVGFEGSHADFVHFLRTDPQFYAKSAMELIKEATYLSKKIDALLPKLFYKLPRTPYGVAPVPDSIAPKYTTGRYISPSRDDQPGYYWVNTYALDKRPLYSLPALTLHEAVPGHHLQNALASEMDHLPPVRRYTYISAFGEGWGLYSEYLGKEIGFYETPYDEFGRLSYEMWRACRLVVDTGMHMQGWSRQQAIDYMLENTALSAHNVTTEIDRYISWPGQALSYKLGEITIKRLRKEAEQQLGEHFDLRAFHDMLLENGSVPLNVLEQHVRDYIKAEKAAQTS